MKMKGKGRGTEKEGGNEKANEKERNYSDALWINNKGKPERRGEWKKTHQCANYKGEMNSLICKKQKGSIYKCLSFSFTEEAYRDNAGREKIIWPDLVSSFFETFDLDIGQCLKKHWALKTWSCHVHSHVGVTFQYAVQCGLELDWSQCEKADTNVFCTEAAVEMDFTHIEHDDIF